MSDEQLHFQKAVVSVHVPVKQADIPTETFQVTLPQYHRNEHDNGEILSVVFKDSKGKQKRLSVDSSYDDGDIRVELSDHNWDPRNGRDWELAQGEYRCTEEDFFELYRHAMRMLRF